MGKNSLIKSTSKKKKSQKKTDSQRVLPAGGESESIAKPHVKAAPPKKEVPKAPAAAPTYRDLIFKKFTEQHTQKPDSVASHEKDNKNYQAPPFYSSKIQMEIKNFKALLFKKFELPGLIPADEEKLPADTPQPAVVAAAPAEKIVLPVKPTPPLRQVLPGQKVDVSYASEKAPTPSDPRDNMMKLAVGVFVFFVLIVLGASFSNHGTHWLISKNGKTEVWQGRFAPMGKVLLMTIPDTVQTDNGDTSGSKKEIFPALVAWHLNKADEGLEIAGTPDFKEIRSLLSAAAPFAVNPEMKKEIVIRSHVIDLMTLLYKAQVTASLETVEGFERALVYLEEARSLQTDEIQMDLVVKKISEMEKKLADLGVPASGLAPVKDK